MMIKLIDINKRVINNWKMIKEYKKQDKPNIKENTMKCLKNYL
jgi:hypothetical protein